MKSVVLSSVLLCLMGCGVFAQTTLPNLSLEMWTDFGNYEEPSGGVWTTANKTVDLAPGIVPETTLKSTDAHSGTYAARMVTARWPIVNLLLTGTLATGTFNTTATPPDNLQMGMPFTGRPDKFKGWYKYNAQGGDSCDIYAILSKWNTGTNQRETVGEAWLRSDQAVTAYTQYDLSFTYTSGDTPDTISIVFASSAAGDQLMGQVGAELFIDEIEFEYATGISQVLMPEAAVKAYPSPAAERVTLEWDKRFTKGAMRIYDVTGKVMAEQPANGMKTEFQVTDWPAGTYHYLLLDGESKMASGTFMVQ